MKNAITKLERSCGVLLHVTSLPSKHGIGDMGEEAYQFIDFLKESKQKYWQILPLNDTDSFAHNSPYQCCSTFAGNPLLINLEKLVDDNLLAIEDVSNSSLETGSVDYERVSEFKEKLLAKAYTNYKNSKDSILTNEINQFIEENDSWLNDYALYKVISNKVGTLKWIEWEEGIKNRRKESILDIECTHYDEIQKNKFIQFLFFKQWSQVKKYANKNGIQIIGDIPIYVAYESADVWSNRKLFDLGEDGYPENISGVAPDFFAKDGQVWGNPLYNWDEHKKTSYDWWIKRVKQALKLVDYLRIDHFIGLERYYSISYKTRIAREGVYKKGPSYEIMEAFKENLVDMPLIAEDLGTIIEEVEMLRDKYSLPGMRILQFGFDCEDALGYNPRFTPHNYVPNTIVYTGTHDNMTLKQWYTDCDTDDRSKQNFKKYINKEHLPDDEVDICWEMIRLAYASVASVAILPLQDILELGENGRMNAPGYNKKNWTWRFEKEQLTIDKVERLKSLAILYER